MCLTCIACSIQWAKMSKKISFSHVQSALYFVAPGLSFLWLGNERGSDNYYNNTAIIQDTQHTYTMILSN